MCIRDSGLQRGGRTLGKAFIGGFYGSKSGLLHGLMHKQRAYQSREHRSRNQKGDQANFPALLGRCNRINIILRRTFLKRHMPQLAGNAFFAPR